MSKLKTNSTFIIGGEHAIGKRKYCPESCLNMSRKTRSATIGVQYFLYEMKKMGPERSGFFLSSSVNAFNSHHS